MVHTVRISPSTDAIIRELADQTGKSKIMILEEALESYRFHERMRLFNDSYAKLREDEKAWAEELKERKILEGTIADGFEDESF